MGVRQRKDGTAVKVVRELKIWTEMILNAGRFCGETNSIIYLYTRNVRNFYVGIMT